MLNVRNCVVIFCVYIYYFFVYFSLNVGNVKLDENFNFMEVEIWFFVGVVYFYKECEFCKLYENDIYLLLL